MLSGLSLIAVVGVIAFYWFKVSVPPNGPISLGLQSYTNACAVITVTNRSNIQFDHGLMVERKPKSGWPRQWPIGTVWHEHGTLRPGITTLTMPVMVYVPPRPWRISMYCSPPDAPFKVNHIQQSAAFLVYKLGMRKLSLKVLMWGQAARKGISVSTPEVEQWQK